MLLITEFTTERGEAYTVLQLLKRLRRAIIQIDGILFNHQERIEILEIDVEKLKDDVENIYSELLIINNRLDIIDVRLDNIDIRLDNIDSKIVNIENSITAIEIKITAIEENIENIENNIDNIETILNNHDADILELNTLVTNITTELNDLQDIVDSIPIVQPSLLNGYIKIDGVDTLVYQDDGSGTGGETFKSNKSLLPYKQFGANDYGVYKNVFNYLVGDEITKTIDNSVLNYTFRYPCVYGVSDETPPVVNLQLTIGGTQLNFGALTLSKDAANKNFNLECEIMISKNESSDYNIRALMRFYTADPEIWKYETLIKTMFSSETGVVIVPQDSLKFNVMLQNSYLNIGWYQSNPAIPPVSSASWQGIFETDLITDIIGSD